MLAATADGKEGEGSPPKTLPMSVQVGTPKTRQAAKRAAAKESPASTEKPAKQLKGSVSTPKTQKTAQVAEDADSGLRRSSRRKSSTPKWRPKDLLESESEEEEEEEEEKKEVKEEKETTDDKPVTRKRGRPPKSAADVTPVTPKTTPSQKGRKPKIKTEPPDRPVKVSAKQMFF